MKPTFVANACAVLVALLTVQSQRLGVSAQVANDQVRDEVVALGVMIVVRGNVYSPAKNGPVIFVGEEVLLDVTVSNNTDSDIELGGDGRSWLAPIGLDINKREHESPDHAAAQIVAKARRSPPSGRVTLSPRRSINAQVALETAEGQPLPPGLYTIGVSVPDLERAGRHKSISGREIGFEVRQASTHRDRLDEYLHHSFRARLANQPTQVREWANRVLALHPNSLAAWLDIVDSYEREGDCKGAVPALNRALAILLSDGDADLLVRPPQSHAVVLQEKLRSCGVK